MASSSADVVDLLRAAVRSSLAATPDDALSALTFLDEAGAAVQDVRSAASVRFSSDEGEPIVISKSQPTRVARDRSSSALTDGTSTPSSRSAAFLPLDSLLFALSTRNEINSTYIRDATAGNIVRLSTLERRGILDWLLGEKESWEGALSVEECSVRDAKADVAGPSTTPPGTPPPSVMALRSDVPLAASATDAAASAPTLALSSSLKRPYHVSRSDQAFVKRLRSSGTEVVLRDRNHSLRGSRFWEKTADFESARQSVKRAIDAIRGVSSAAGGAKGTVPARPAATPVSSSLGTQKRRPADPIIVLSNSPTSLINMHNVKALLEDGIFVAPDEARARAGGASAEGIVIVNRKVSSNAVSAPGMTSMQSASALASNNARTRFVVVDNADSLAKLAGGGGADPWDRVVAVFTTGQAWQFRNYRWSEPRELWKNVLGVYVRWSNEPESPAIRDWAIQKLAVDRTKRHTDRQLVAHLWRSIDGYIARKKSFLQGGR